MQRNCGWSVPTGSLWPEESKRKSVAQEPLSIKSPCPFMKEKPSGPILEYHQKPYLRYAAGNERISVKNSPHPLPTHCGSSLELTKRGKLWHSLSLVLLVVACRVIRIQSHEAASIWSRRRWALRNFYLREKILVHFGSGHSKCIRHHELCKQWSMLQSQVLSMLFSLLIIIVVVRSKQSVTSNN